MLKKLKFMSFVLVVLFVLMGSSNALFSQTKVLSLDEAIKTALENNANIRISQMEVNKAQHAVKEAFGYAMPTVDLSGNFNHFLSKSQMPFPDFESMLTNATYSILFDENVVPRDDSKFLPMGTTLMSFVQTNSFEAKADVSQILFSSAVFRGIGASQIYLQTSEMALKGAAASTILDVKKTFYGILLLKNMLDITKSSLDNAEANLKNVTALHQGGLVSEYDMLQAEVMVENFRPTVIQTENALKTALDGLKIILGYDQDMEIDITGSLDYNSTALPERDILVERALESNYNIKTMDYKKQVDKAFIDLDLSEYWPTLVAFGSMSYNGTSDDFNFQTYNSSIVGLSLSINLFKGNRTFNKVQQSKITAQQTEEQYKQLKDAIAMQVRTKLLEIEKVERYLAAQERNVELAERAFSIANTRYREGEGNQLEVQNSEIALRQARINRLSYVHDFIVAKSELDELLGNIEPGYLEFLRK